MDRGRTIHRYQTFASATAAREWLQSIDRRDRTEGQEVSVYLGVEKAGIVAQLQEWFGDSPSGRSHSAGTITTRSLTT